MRRFLQVCAAGVVMAFGSATAMAATTVPKAIADAVANPSRPAADTARDADRKPAEVMTFVGVKPGQSIGELIPGGGYYTRLLAAAVGPSGHVYALWPEALLTSRPQIAQGGAAIGPNVSVVGYSTASLNAPAKLDLVWTSENYHDMHNTFPPGGPAPDIAAFNKAVFDALKPGGIYLIEDHAAAAGAKDVTNTLHRIDPAQVKSEVEAAGFKLVGESDLLKNPADTHELKVQDPAIRGHTDKMLFRFRKP